MFKKSFFHNVFLLYILFQDILDQPGNNNTMKILLENIMVKKNLSLRQVSLLTGIPKSTIYDIVAGRKSPSMDTMEKLAKGLKVRISDLYDSPYKW